MFLTAANPSIKNGGFIMERKKDVYDLLPARFYPSTLYFEPGAEIKEVTEKIQQAGIQFPFIAKPDIGERGLAVKKIENVGQLAEYAEHIPVGWLAQAFVPYEKEVGIFYCRPPKAAKGFISGIVNKEPVTVVGDGVNTVTELVKQNERYLLQLDQIIALNSGMMDVVLPNGVSHILVPYGNHSRGSKFTDETYRVTPKLSEAIDRICSQIPEFYYGRLDIRFESWEQLENGEAFSIIEVNGSGSEPTHIYDPGHSLFFAWKEIVRHWDILYSICKANNSKGVRYLTLAQGRAEINAFKAIDARLSARNW